MYRLAFVFILIKETLKSPKASVISSQNADVKPLVVGDTLIMETRVCKQCGEEKTIDRYCLTDKVKNVRTRTCRTCIGRNSRKAKELRKALGDQNQDLDGELWKDIEEFEDYQVSNLGRIKRKSYWCAVGSCVPHQKPDRILKPFYSESKEFDDNIYLLCKLYKFGGTKKFTKKIHRLVAEAFVPNPENKPEVNHDDGNKKNNRWDNLVWATHSENVQHGYDNGLNFGAEGKVPCAQLSPDGFLIEEFPSISAAAKAMNADHHQIYRAIQRKRLFRGFLWV